MAHRRERGPKGPSFLAPIRSSVVTAVVAMWGQTLSLTALFLVAARVLDDLLAGRPLDAALAGWLIALVVLRAAFAAIVPWVTIGAWGRLETWMRGRLYRHLLVLGTPLRSRRRTGELVSTSTEAVELAATFEATFVGPIIASMTVPLLIIAVAGHFLDGFSAWILLISVPAVPLMVGGFQQGFARVSEEFRETGTRLAGRFLDALQGLPTLALFNQSKAHGRKLADAAESLRRAIMRLLAGNQLVLLVVDSLFSLGMITAAAVLAMLRFRDGALTAGEAIALVFLGVQLTEPLDKVGQFFYVGMGGAAAAKEVRGALAEQSEVPEAADAVAPADADSSIGVHGISFAHGDVPVLHHVTFEVAAGETLALVGPSGAGKTTITNLLQRSLAPDAGTIAIGGVDVSTVPADWVRSQITVVAQGTYLFTGTLRENLLIADPTADDAQLRAALTDANLDAFVEALPYGLDTPVGERGLSVSGGQAQRIAIARALLKDAPIVILDEPTSNVDVESEAAILAALDRLTADRTVIVIAHRLSTIRDADRILVLEDGRVAELGTHAELLSGDGHYARAVEHAQLVEVGP